MFAAMNSRVLVAGVVLVTAVSVVCLAETVNINPYKIVLNAEGKADDVQANIPMFLPSAEIVGWDVTLKFNDEDKDIIVAQAESARYCVIDDMLIIGFNRTDLQNNSDVQALANQTVKATVEGYVTVRVKYLLGIEEDKDFYFSGTDDVEIVKPGNKPGKKRR